VGGRLSAVPTRSSREWQKEVLQGQSFTTNDKTTEKKALKPVYDSSKPTKAGHRYLINLSKELILKNFLLANSIILR
jgi:hypothetical protein